MILGVDPGPLESAFALVSRGYCIFSADKFPNERFWDRRDSPLYCREVEEVAVESIQSYGMAVGRSVFDTCYTIGRIQQICCEIPVPCYLYPRPEYARALAGGSRITDSLLRRSLLLRFGGDRKGEPLHMLRGNPDKRSAFAVAAYHIDKGGFQRMQANG